MIVIKKKLSVLVLYCTGYVELAQWIEGWPKKRAFPWLMAKTFVRPRTSGEMDGHTKLQHLISTYKTLQKFHIERLNIIKVR